VTTEIMTVTMDVQPPLAKSNVETQSSRQANSVITQPLLQLSTATRTANGSAETILSTKERNAMTETDLTEIHAPLSAS